MNENFQKLKELYKVIYEITQNINISIKNNNLDEIEKALGERGILINESNKIITSFNLSDTEKAEIDNLIKIIKKIERDNLDQMEVRYQGMMEELAVINKNYKVASAYKVNKENKPRLIDTEE